MCQPKNRLVHSRVFGSSKQTGQAAELAPRNGKSYGIDDLRFRLAGTAADDRLNIFPKLLQVGPQLRRFGIDLFGVF